MTIPQFPIVGILLLGVLFCACSDNRADIETNGDNDIDGDTSVTPQYYSKSSHEISPEGTTIEMDGLWLFFPKKAVGSLTDITIRRIPRDQAPELLRIGGARIVPLCDLWEFGPEGIVFNEPVGVTIAYEHDFSANLEMYWTRPDGTGIFEPVADADFFRGIAHGSILHFSRSVIGYSEEIIPDGDAEHLPPEDNCRSDSECGDDSICIGGLCQLAPNFSKKISWMAHLALPSDLGLTDYGFDLDNDGEIDNKLDSVANTIALILSGSTSTGYSDIPWHAIIEDFLNNLIEFTEWPDESSGPVNFRFLKGQNDLDLNGIKDQEYDIRYKGDGLHRVDRYNLLKPENTPIFEGWLEENILTARANNPWKISFPMTRTNEPPIVFELWDMRMRANLWFFRDDIATIDVFHTEDSQAGKSDYIEGGAMIGGVISLPSIMDSFNRIADVCFCADLDPDIPLIEYRIEDGKFSASCIQDVSRNEELCIDNYDQPICAYFSAICYLLPVLGGFTDISTGRLGVDGKPGLDAISAAFAMSFQPTTLADPPLMPSYFAADDYFQVANNQIAQPLLVLLNDADDVNGTPKILSVSKPDHNGEVSISDDGKMLLYTPSIGWLEEEHFTYTIEAYGNDESDHITGYVDIEINAPHYEHEINRDTFTVEINRGWHDLDIFANDKYHENIRHRVRIKSISRTPTCEVFPSPDLKMIHFRALPGAVGGEQISLDCELDLGDRIYFHSNFVKINLVRPDDTVCGDGFIDDWADEQCDDGASESGDGCDDQCHLEACPGEPGMLHSTGWADSDGDGFGNPSRPIYYCNELPPGVADNSDDCDDSQENVRPNSVAENKYAGNCADGIDNNCNGLIDCAEPTCFMHSAFCGERACDDGIDNDGDWLADCGDLDCKDTEVCKDSHTH